MPFSRWTLGLVENTRSIHCVAACLILCGAALDQTPRTSWSYDNIITFDAPGAGKDAGQGTSPQAINDQGEIAGYFFTDPNGVRHGFVRHKEGTFAKFDPPGSVGTVARSINETDEFTGNYVSDDVAHGFIGRRNGMPTTFDPPGSDNTAPQSINAHGEIAGYYADAANGLHGFVRHADRTYAKFDVPGAVPSAGKGTLNFA